MAGSRFVCAWAAALLCSLVLAVPAHSAPAGAHQPTPVAFMVVCDDASVREKLTSRLGELLEGQVGYVIRKEFPSAQLIVYANRDANDRINPKGYSIAVAHVSNAEVVFLAKKLLVEKPTEDESLKQVLTAMLKEHGMLDYLNVIHMDEATDVEIDALSRAVVAEFTAKTPPNVG